MHGQFEGSCRVPASKVPGLAGHYLGPAPEM